MRLFGMAHLLILVAIVSVAVTVTWACRRSPAAQRSSRLVIGCLLIANELVWYAFRYSQEGFRFPEGLPLELCDVVVWITAFACLRLSVTATEFVYFAGLGGSGMALLTPDLWAPLLSYPSIYFFVAHGTVVIAIAALVFGRQVLMRSGCVWRVFGLLNVYAAAVGAFNLVFRTNYFYLCSKPESASILDWFGPWPYYILVAEFFALGLFYLMWLPLRHGVQKQWSRWRESNPRPSH
jgi:hypothetical integral membrane protein (TIGR02206 family)